MTHRTRRSRELLFDRAFAELVIPTGESAAAIRSGKEQPKPLDLRRWEYSFDTLECLISLTGISGEWVTLARGIREFRTEHGAKMFWCPRTHKLGFSGPYEAIARLSRRMIAVVNLAASVPDEGLEMH